MLPAGLTSVGAYAFESCESLRSVAFLGSADMWAAVEIGEGNECLISAAITHGASPADYSFILPSGTRVIGSRAFAGVSLPDGILIPEGVEEIAPDAFEPGTLLRVPSGSPWAQWAEDHGYRYAEY